MKTGVDLIAEERARQINALGWDEENDDSHTDGELAVAGACYAMADDYRDIEISTGDEMIEAGLWPWHIKYWNPTPNNRVRELQKAGALIAAEIDRLNRK